MVRLWIPAVVSVLSMGCLERRAADAPPPPAITRAALPEQSADALKALGYADRTQALPAAAPPAKQAPADAAALMPAARKLIRTGQLTIEVERFALAAEAVAKLAESEHGYLPTRGLRRAIEARNAAL